MDSERHLRKKYTLRAHGEQVVFVKQKHEREAHVWMKAYLWALYLPDYPDMAVEITINDRYTPDVVSFGTRRQPRFWGEAGAVSSDKTEYLVRRYPRTHFALSKWNAPIQPIMNILREAGADERRFAPVDVLRFPADSKSKFMNHRGDIKISFEEVELYRLGAFRPRL